MLITTFNVNSLKSRLPIVKPWLENKKPDVVLLQEIKGLEDIFPQNELKDLGYNFAYVLQKTYNGVATLTKQPHTETLKNIPFFEDTHARFLEIEIDGIKFINVYAPNGNPINSPKYDYKLNWLNAFYNYVEGLVKKEADFVIGGDFNIIPYDYDVYNPDNWKNDALFQTSARKIYFKLLHLGLTDVIDICYPGEPERYTWWDYRNNGFTKNRGVRIDHILLSPRMAIKLNHSSIDKTLRYAEKPSDHTPVSCYLSV